MPSRKRFDELDSVIVGCDRCPRLRRYSRLIARKKKPALVDWEYWAKPVPGFGDLKAKLFVLGLAPATHGGTRTGRIFTGDTSSRFLVRALHDAGFANQPISESRDDGLVYSDCYVTAAVKCAPPGDRPTPREFSNCSGYLDEEIALLTNLRVVLALGSLAFKAFLDHLGRKGTRPKGLRFSHGARYDLGGVRLYASYHPSPRNTNTGLLTPNMLLELLRRIGSDLG